MRQPWLMRYVSLRRSFTICVGRECQYLPSTSMAIRAGMIATSMAYCPIRYSVAYSTPRSDNAPCTASSIELVRGHVVATHAPEHRREQNRNRGTIDGLTATIFPHISHAISTFGLKSGCCSFRIDLFQTLTQVVEQKRRSWAFPSGTAKDAPHCTHVTDSLGFALWAGSPRRAAAEHAREQNRVLRAAPDWNASPQCAHSRVSGGLPLDGVRP